MNDRTTLMAGSVLGALIGVTVSFLYFTEEGRSWRMQAEANLESLAREAEKLLGAVDQVRQGVAEIRSGQGGSWQRSA